MGLQKNAILPGLEGDVRMKGRSNSVQLTDRVLTGMSGNVSAALGLGIFHSTTYAGGGKAVHSTGRTYGASLEASTTRDLLSLGDKSDGRYLEMCIGAGAIGFLQVCGGYSWSGKSFYGSTKVGTGAGAGLTVVDGWQDTVDYLPEKPVYTIPAEMQPIISRQPFNAPGL